MQDEQEEFEKFLSDISPTLRQAIMKEIFTIAIKKNELLKQFEEPHNADY